MTVVAPSRLPDDEEFEKKLREIRAGKNPSQKETMKLAEKSPATDEEIATRSLAMLIQEKEELEEEGIPAQ